MHLPRETRECFLWFWMTQSTDLHLKYQKQPLATGETLGFVWITEFIGARDVFVFLGCHAKRLLGWSHFKLCQIMSWDSKSKKVCGNKHYWSNEQRWSLGSRTISEEAKNMLIRKKDSPSDPPGSDIMKVDYSSIHHQPNKDRSWFFLLFLLLVPA